MKRASAKPVTSISLRKELVTKDNCKIKALTMVPSQTINTRSYESKWNIIKLFTLQLRTLKTQAIRLPLSLKTLTFWSVNYSGSQKSFLFTHTHTQNNLISCLSYNLYTYVNMESSRSVSA